MRQFVKQAAIGAVIWLGAAAGMAFPVCGAENYGEKTDPAVSYAGTEAAVLQKSPAKWPKEEKDAEGETKAAFDEKEQLIAFYRNMGWSEADAKQAAELADIQESETGRTEQEGKDSMQVRGDKLLFSVGEEALVLPYTAEEFLAEAAARLGAPYVWGGKGGGYCAACPEPLKTESETHPDCYSNGYDCSGFVYDTLSHFGISGDFSADICGPAGLPLSSNGWISVWGNAGNIGVSYQGKNSCLEHVGVFAVGQFREKLENGCFLPGDIIAAYNPDGSSISHVYFYFGRFDSRDEVISYLVQELGIDQEAADAYTADEGTEWAGGVHWRIEAHGSDTKQGAENGYFVRVNNSFEGKGAASMYEVWRQPVITEGGQAESGREEGSRGEGDQKENGQEEVIWKDDGQEGTAASEGVLFIPGETETAASESRYEEEKQGGRIEIYSLGEALIGYENGMFVYAMQPQEGAVFEIITAEEKMPAEEEGQREKIGQEETAPGHYETGTLIETIVTGADGYALSQNLPDGRYRVRQVFAPNGRLNGNTEDETGERTVLLERPYSCVGDYIQDTAPFENRYPETRITVHAQSGADGTPLADVLFGLYTNMDIAASEGMLLAEAGECIGTGRTDAEGTLYFRTDIPYGSYDIRRLEPVNGYVCDVRSFEFTAGVQAQHLIEAEFAVDDHTGEEQPAAGRQEETNPENTDPENTDPENTDPENINPEYIDPENINTEGENRTDMQEESRRRDTEFSFVPQMSGFGIYAGTGMAVSVGLFLLSLMLCKIHGQKGE